jgi:hypothetical protein
MVGSFVSGSTPLSIHMEIHWRTLVKDQKLYKGKLTSIQPDWHYVVGTRWLVQGVYIVLRSNNRHRK